MNVIWAARGTRNAYISIVIGAFIQYHYPDSGWLIMPLIAIMMGIKIKK
ncbi:hypothetical protein AB7W68_11895 [Providencia rettgeri]